MADVQIALAQGVPEEAQEQDQRSKRHDNKGPHAPPPEKKCHGKTKEGTSCARWSVFGQTFCQHHIPITIQEECVFVIFAVERLSFVCLIIGIEGRNSIGVGCGDAPGGQRQSIRADGPH